MPKFFQEIFNFIKKYPGILYSLFLIVFIPLALFYHTFSVVDSFQKNIDYNLHSKALIVENILGKLLAEFFSQPELLKEEIKKIIQENPEISHLRIIEEAEDGQFKILASQNPKEEGEIIQDPSLVLSWTRNETFANLISEKGERLWKVINPIYDREGKKLGLVSMNLSLSQADSLVKKSIYWAYFLIFIIILLALFLIIHHTKLFGFVALSKKLQEIDKMKDEFIRMATHELQSPIANIRGYISALKEEISDSLTQIQKEYLQRIVISAKNLSDLVSDILEVSRIEQGRLDFALQKIYPLSLIREIIEELKLKAEQKNLSLVLENLEEKPCQIEINVNRFRQILINLLENSIKYTFEGQILIRTNCDQKRYIIEIKDSGIGISAENQLRLFEKFYRVKTRETAGIPGTGLGLWITKQLTEKMGGKIFLESMEKVGTKFTLIFPLAKK